MAEKEVDSLGAEARGHIERNQIELGEDKHDLAAVLPRRDPAAMREGLNHVTEISDVLRQLNDILAHG
jgi:hypothetical protein